MYKIDQINDPLIDPLIDQINPLGIEIIKIINSHPGIKIPQIIELLSNSDRSINADAIRNEIRRELKGYTEYRGSRKTGGYYIKKK